MFSLLLIYFWCSKFFCGPLVCTSNDTKYWVGTREGSKVFSKKLKQTTIHCLHVFSLLLIYFLCSKTICGLLVCTSTDTKYWVGTREGSKVAFSKKLKQTTIHCLHVFSTLCVITLAFAPWNKCCHHSQLIWASFPIAQHWNPQMWPSHRSSNEKHFQ